MKIIVSPLRYPGSKIRLVRYMGKVLEFNKCQPDVLVEPFAGGGSVFINFLENDWVERAIIGDRDSLIYSFWKVLFEDPNYLIEFTENVPVNLETFRLYKSIAADESHNEKRTLAEACLFLNRTSFSGILAANAGAIGGRNQKSQYKIDCRFNRRLLVERMKHISSFASRVTVLPYDWSRTIDYALKQDTALEKFVYLDPPFYNKADKLYRHYFDELKPHLALSRKLKQLKHKWILSYDRAPEVKKMYESFIQRSFAFPYTINSPARRIEKEYFITSHDLKRPPKGFLTK
jgi:DNA adenine methylase